MRPKSNRSAVLQAETQRRSASQEQKVLEKASEEARTTAQEAWEEARAQGIEAWADVAELVQKHPAKAMGASVLLGLVFGTLAFRRR